jgi:alkaline phosphatase
MSTGVKTYGGAIGVDLDQNPLIHALQVAEAKEKSTGVVTSVEWTHATPAGFVAHNVSRNNYAAIGVEMIYDSAADVIMGAGNPCYDADGVFNDCTNTFKYVGGETTGMTWWPGPPEAMPTATALPIPGRSSKPATSSRP